VIRFGRLVPPAAARQILLSGLAVLTGLLAGTVVLAFRALTNALQASFLPGGQVGNYEALGAVAKLLLPVGGAVVLAAWFHRLAPETRQVGVVHVLDRMMYHGGRLPLRNAVVQFLGGVLAIVSGQSVDREGPGVHLGAAAGSLLGQHLGYSDATLPPLVACGTAASIAVAFNTPLAGVVFALEVVVMEYAVASITPVILSSVIGAVIGRAFYGPEPSFSIPTLGTYSMATLAFVIPLGIGTGLIGALFTSVVEGVSRFTFSWSVLGRFLLSGLLTGICAQWAPEIMGIGYDTLQRILMGHVGLALLVAIVPAKLVATATAVGAGLPGGLIGGTLVLGAAWGGTMAHAGAQLFPEALLPVPLLTMVGMAAMMAAVLNAPLAALTALLELTDDPHVILPGMLAVVTADLVATAAGKDSVFLALLRSHAKTP
jgi:chloride channel protein, CIC family